MQDLIEKSENRIKALERHKLRTKIATQLMAALIPTTLVAEQAAQTAVALADVLLVELDRVAEREGVNQ